MFSSPRFRRPVASLVAGSLTFVSALPTAPGWAAPVSLRNPVRLDGPPLVYAITNARIVPVSGKPIDKGTVVFRDGLITAVGEKVDVPADAQTIDGAGLTVYPALVDAYTRWGMPNENEYTATRGDGYPVVTVRSENTAVGLLKPDATAAGQLRQAGFGAVLAAPYVGLFSGTSAVVSLAESDDAASLVIRPNVAMHLAFFAPDPVFGYPGSLMGNIAVTRQAFYDAVDAAERLKNYEKSPGGKPRPVVTRAVSALIPVVEKQQPLVVEAESGADIKRVLKLSREFGITPIIEGATDAYAVADTLKEAKTPVLLSANLPQAPRVAPGEEDPTTLQGLRRRALATTAAAALAKAGVPFALTTSGMTLTNNGSEFKQNVRKMIAAGLTEEQALTATTLTPAKILGVDRQLGSLDPGKIANVVAVEGGSLFSATGRIKYLFVDGKKVVLEGGGAAPGGGFGGRFGGGGGYFAQNLPPGVPPNQVAQFRRQVAGQAAPPDGGDDGAQGQGGVGRTDDVAAPPLVGTGPVPPLPAPIAGSFALRGGTVWTSGPQGKIENADVYVKDGKIAAVGTGLKVPGGTLEIDAKGKHITPGMIDCHSHTAIQSGINEGTHIVTAECRIQDVLNPDDPNIYRQLAGGTTAANVLHGSANAIGGQNAVVKWRWGSDAEGLLLKGAPEGIKFALGENPTRSNGGIPTNGTRRYPATRMGVERVIRAEFLEARDYQKQWAAYKAGKQPVPPRRNLQLDAIVEILEGKRLVHCHSYRSDEILMLTRLAEEFGFKIATFQHVLEGYKVADELAKHGVGGSTFSDWWGYKIEAYDAIPYNAALMTERGVVMSFNSDSDELARRLNYEAAKAVRYGGMKPEEALKLVTINPAKQLRIDKMTGSLEPGKDADIAVWTGDPLSTMTVCDKTFVDGKLFFDREQDAKARVELDAEKKRLQTALNPAPVRGPGFGGRGTGNPGQTPPSSANPPATPPANPPGAPPTGNAFQRSARVTGGPRVTAPVGPVTAIVGATVHPLTSPDIPDGVVIMQGGKITAVGAAGSVAIPADAKKIDATGQHVYPGLIDADTTVGVNEIESRRETQDYQEMGQFSPELRACIVVNPDAETIRVARNAGILNAVTCPAGQTISGMGALLQLDGWTWEDFAIVPCSGLYVNFPTLGFRRFRETAHHCEETAGVPVDTDDDPLLRSGEFIAATSYDAGAVLYGYLPDVASLLPQQPPAAQPPVAPGGQRPGGGGGRRRGFGGGQGTPGGPGVPGIPAADALLRPLNDFLNEARAYKTAKEAADKGGNLPPMAHDPRLEAMMPVLDGKIPVFIRAERARDIRGAVAWAKKENLRMILVGGQEADKAVDVLVAEKVPVILGPVLNLPSAADAPYDDAYTLPARLAKAGVRFCLSTGSATDVRRLPHDAAMAAAFGLSPDDALKAITLYPAQILGAESRLGSIEPGKDADLIITTGNPLEITSDVKAAFVSGNAVDLTTHQTRLYDKWRARPRP